MFRVLPGKPGHAPVPHTVPPMGPGRGSMGCCGANINRESGRTFYRPNHPPSLRIKAAVTKPTHTHPLPPQIKTVYTLFMAIIHRDVGDKSTQHKLTTISQFAAGLHTGWPLDTRQQLDQPRSNPEWEEECGPKCPLAIVTVTGMSWYGTIGTWSFQWLSHDWHKFGFWSYAGVETGKATLGKIHNISQWRWVWEIPCPTRASTEHQSGWIQGSTIPTIACCPHLQWLFLFVRLSVWGC